MPRRSNLHVSVSEGRAESATAFTLVELLTVIAIIAVLAALIYPLIAGAIRSGHKAVAISNLHQCTQALALYAESADGAFPTRESASRQVGKDISNDPDDNWRRNWNEDLGEPFVGSFGYVLSNPTALGLVKKQSDPILFVDIFRCDEHYPRFSGDTPDPETVQRDPDSFFLPKRVFVANQSGSVFWMPISQGDPKGRMVIAWSWIFIDLSGGDR